MRFFTVLLLCFSLGCADYYGNIRQCDLAAIEKDLQAGINVNTRDPQGYTALAYAAEKNDTELMEMLFEYKALPDIPNKTGYTPLNLAAGWGNLEAVQLLLSRQASANLAAEDGTTPLMQAARYGYSEVVKALLAAGADPTRENSTGATARSLAQEWGYKEIAAIINLKTAPEKTTAPSRRRRPVVSPEAIVSVNLTEAEAATPDITQQPEETPAVAVTINTLSENISLETEPVSRNLP